MNKKQDIFDKDAFHQAGQDLIRKVREAEQDDSRDASLSWQAIENRLELPRKASGLRIGYLVSGVAAAVTLLLAVGCYFWLGGSNESSLSLALLEENNISALPDGEILLIEDKQWVQLEDEASIVYDSEGKLDDQKFQVEKARTDTEVKTEKNNQIIVPKGRRASVVFSDGTKIHVNAGSRVIYPVVFASDKREILVEGEAYLDVTPDASRPFIVKTNGFEVKVLGTQFNICAYKDTPAASVVLVEGRVEVNTAKNDKATLVPNQLIEINEKGTRIKEVDVFEYICWKDNLMQLNNHKVGEALDKLACYYGRTILFDKEVGEIPISGKLDLRVSLEEVVEIICQSVFLKQEVDKDNNIIISK